MENNEYGFVHAIKDGFVRWNEIDGCSTKSEYWYYALFEFVYLIFTYSISVGNTNHLHQNYFWITLLVDLLLLVIYIPGITLSIRRLHDSNHSGWNIFWNIVPYIGWLYFIYLCCLPSKRYYLNHYWLMHCWNRIRKRKVNEIMSEETCQIYEIISSIDNLRERNPLNPIKLTTNENADNTIKHENVPICPETYSLQGTEQVLPAVMEVTFKIADEGANHFNMTLSKEGKFEVIMFDIWFILESLRAKGFNINPKEEIEMIENFLVDTCKKLALPTENKFERIYTLRELTDGWEKEMRCLAYSDYPRTKQYLPGYLYLCFIRNPLIVYPDDSIVEEKLSSVTLSELADFYIAFSEHQNWLRDEINKIKV